MPEVAEHHREERVVAGPNPTKFYYARIAACNQGEIAYLQIVEQEGLTTLALPHFLMLAVSKQADVLAELTFQCLTPKCLIYKFHLITYTYNSPYLHGRGIQTGGRRVLS